MISYTMATSYLFQLVLIGIAVTAIMAWLAIKFTRRVGLIDIPGSAPHKKHKYPTPIAGGVALIGSLAVMIILTGLWKQPGLIPLLVGTLIIFAMGVWDDARNIPALLKLIIEIGVAVLLIISGTYIHVLEYKQFQIGGPQVIYTALDYILTIVWVVGITNAMNMVDSMDGLTLGLSSWAFAFFLLATFVAQQGQLSYFSAIMLGICIGLNFYNTYPALLFMGDSGALTMGYILSVISILYTPSESHQASSWFVPILLVGVPIFDTTLVFFSRLRRRIPVFGSNLDHTYHRLVMLGLEPQRAVLAMHMAALMLECTAFIAVTLSPLPANILFIICLIIGAICILLLDNLKRWT